MRRYACESNERWEGFVHRSDDIVISTRSKSGTTWLQMICALLVFHEKGDLPEPLAAISPWLDWDVEPPQIVIGRLEAQTHRRIIKTHTPLDGLPLNARVSYLVTGRHPLDMAVSMYHHRANIDRARVAELRNKNDTTASPGTLEQWLTDWIRNDDAPETRLESLRGTLHHLSDAWTRQDTFGVTMVHYQDLIDDLEGQMRRLAGVLDVQVPEARWPDLVSKASFTSMRARADDTVPQHLGVFVSNRAFFRSGRSGEGQTVVSDDEMAEYLYRAEDLAPAELLAWLHR